MQTKILKIVVGVILSCCTQKIYAGGPGVTAALEGRSLSDVLINGVGSLVVIFLLFEVISKFIKDKD